MPKVYHAIYLTIIGALVIVVVGLLTPSSTDEPNEASNHRVVVFPFHSMDSSSDRLATELTAKLIQSLEGSQNIDVVLESDLPSKSYSAENHHLWAKKAFVTLIFEGAVQSRGENARITAQIIDGLSDSHIWAETFELRSDAIKGILTTIEDKILVLANR